MANDFNIGDGSREIACRWCERRGVGWTVLDQLGQGGTAPVFEVMSPSGPRALKIYDAEFSSGKKGEIELSRIEHQLTLRGHSCPYLVQVYEGGEFERRLFLLMSRAPGQELEKRLGDVPRGKIRQIVDQVARAAIFLKSKDLCHRDIKAANVFVNEDFSHATLLDISVIRDVHDPVGSGTDHDGQLPVLATARYSPPEYLFRLLDAGPELWHALTIYQLGALLHDLIMKESLFRAEYLRSRENRYRFAWIVATEVPRVLADDVDQDLVFTARRALDKEWKQRSSLRLEDFLADSNVQKSHALALLGLGTDRAALRRSDEASLAREHVRDIAKILDGLVSDRLRRIGATAQHNVDYGADDNSKMLTFRWNVSPVGLGDATTSLELRVSLSIVTRLGKFWFKSSAEIRTVGEGEPRRAGLELPDVLDEPGAESILASQLESALPELAVELARAQT
jgi:serine/threonine protein kinase